MGSTAWAEIHSEKLSGDTLLRNAIAYLNVDTAVSGGHFFASGTPSLGAVLWSALRDVPDPRGQSGEGSPRSLLEAGAWDGRLSVLGSGSDYTAFIDALGIASLDFHFSPTIDGAASSYGVYHSVFDSFDWMDHEGDPGFALHVAAAQVWGLVALRLADAPEGALPFNLVDQAKAITGYVTDLRASLTPGMRERLDAQLNDLAAAADEFSDAAKRAHAAPASADRDRRMALTERRFLGPGLPERTFFKHVLQAPGMSTGYGATSLPGVTEPAAAGDTETARAQAIIASQRIREAAAYLGGGDNAR